MSAGREDLEKARKAVTLGQRAIKSQSDPATTQTLEWNQMRRVVNDIRIVRNRVEADLERISGGVRRTPAPSLSHLTRAHLGRHIPLYRSWEAYFISLHSTNKLRDRFIAGDPSIVPELASRIAAYRRRDPDEPELHFEAQSILATLAYFKLARDVRHSTPDIPVLGDPILGERPAQAGKAQTYYDLARDSMLVSRRFEVGEIDRADLEVVNNELGPDLGLGLGLASGH